MAGICARDVAAPQMHSQDEKAYKFCGKYLLQVGFKQ